MLLLLLIFSFLPSFPWSLHIYLGKAFLLWIFYAIWCSVSGERLSPEAEQGPRCFSIRQGIIEPRRLPVPLSQISIQILLWRPPPHLGLCPALGLLSVSQWPQAQGSTSWEISDLQWFGNDIRGSPARLAASGMGHLQSWASRLAWCLCRPKLSHCYLPHLVSQVVWSCVK